MLLSAWLATKALRVAHFPSVKPQGEAHLHQAGAMSRLWSVAEAHRHRLAERCCHQGNDSESMNHPVLEDVAHLAALMELHQDADSLRTVFQMKDFQGCANLVPAIPEAAEHRDRMANQNLGHCCRMERPAPFPKFHDHLDCCLAHCVARCD